MRRGASATDVMSDAGVAASPIDVFIPPYYRHSSLIHHAYPTVVATVDYAEQPGSVGVRYDSYVHRHRTELTPAAFDSRAGQEGSGAMNTGMMGGGGHAFASVAGGLGRQDDVRASAKQGLMEVLLGNAAAGEALLSDVGRALPAPSLTEEVQHRLRGVRCDATYISSPQLLVAIVRTILSKRTDPARTLVDCVAAIDLSNTQLGKVTKDGPPLHFDAGGNAVAGPAEAATTRFYPDESPRRDATPNEIKERVAERSLALTYVAPLLFIPGMRLYCIRELVCSHCALTDHDAHALAIMLRLGGGDNKSGSGGTRRRGPAFFFRRPSGGDGHAALSCTLETLDISFNEITDAGMMEISKALRHNKRVTTLVMAGNRLRHRERIFDEVERRLRRNREGRSSVSWMHLQHWKRRVSKHAR